MARRAFRDGYGRAQLVKYGTNARPELGHIFTHPGAWFPNSLLRNRGRIYGVERLYAAGRPPSRRQLVAMSVVEWAFIQLPMVFGNIGGWFREAVKR